MEKKPESEQNAQLLLAEIAREALIERRRSRRWSIFFKCLTFAYITAAILYALLGHRASLNGGAGQHTAVIDIQGVIAEGLPASATPIVKALVAAVNDSRTAGIILNINSPGGSPVQSGLIYDEIQRIRQANPDLPVHAVIGDVVASGGYYIAAAAENIYANQASIVGSIGVRMDSFGATEAISKLGIERRLLTAGEHKGLLDPFLPVDPIAEQQLQSMLDDIHKQFINAVKRGRGDRLDDNPLLFSGLVWSGSQALENGLIDSLADVRTVARDVIGVEKRRDFTQRQDLLTRMADRIGAQFKITFRQLLVGDLY